MMKIERNHRGWIVDGKRHGVWKGRILFKEFHYIRGVLKKSIMSDGGILKYHIPIHSNFFHITYLIDGKKNGMRTTLISQGIIRVGISYQMRTNT